MSWCCSASASSLFCCCCSTSCNCLQRQWSGGVSFLIGCRFEGEASRNVGGWVRGWVGVGVGVWGGGGGVGGWGGGGWGWGWLGVGVVGGGGGPSLPPSPHEFDGSMLSFRLNVFLRSAHISRSAWPNSGVHLRCMVRQPVLSETFMNGSERVKGTYREPKSHLPTLRGGNAGSPISAFATKGKIEFHEWRSPGSFPLPNSMRMNRILHQISWLVPFTRLHASQQC